MKRSSPVKVKPASLCRVPALMASAAMYSPVGHPSVRCTSSLVLAISGLTPAPSSSEDASSGLIARSSAPTSTIPA